MKMLRDLILYLKFLRKMPIVCPEYEVNCLTGRMDLIALKNNVFHEVEIKQSKKDLWADLRKRKHGCFRKIKDENLSYRNPQYVRYNGVGSTYFIPDYFWFAVPLELVPEAEKLVNLVNENYGIIKYFPAQGNHSSAFCDEWPHTSPCIIHRKAKPLRPPIEDKDQINNLLFDIARTLGNRYLSSIEFFCRKDLPEQPTILDQADEIYMNQGGA